MTQPFFRYIALLAVVVLAGCTTKSQEAPPLSGPSEYGTSISIAIAPDVLSQDGVSQSQITVTAHDSNGQALRNVSLRAEIMLGGVRTDFGSLSARSLVTGSDGRATVVYTAPVAPQITVDTGTVVEISVTPIGTDFNNSSVRTATIRLVPPGTVIPPVGLTPNFDFLPATPAESENVTFTACALVTPCAPANNPVTNYAWTFGDGGSGSGRTTTHSYRAAGVYVVTLTISDGYGRTASTSKSVPVTAAAPLTPDFVSSPSNPLVDQTVNFNAATSAPSTGRTIRTYDWDFGDGSFGQGITTSHNYGLPRAFDDVTHIYVVVLTITDDTGRKASKSNTVSLRDPKPPTGR